MSENLSAYRSDFARIEKRIAGEFDAGKRRWVLAGFMTLLAIGLLLPLTSTQWSWMALADWFGGGAPVSMPLRIFVTLAAVFGVLVSSIALARRSWRFAVAATLGCGLGSFFGLFGYWSQTGMIIDGPHAPGIGMVIAWVSMVALTSQWLPIALSKSPTDPRPRPTLIRSH
ncbi:MULTISPECIES: Rv2732c family membrane protein [unclassified Rhodococcus (in: high G+C Gram-positive bacteria)]|uniref:Rv2732c family membrane protein n=1 Tax=Rhodococcus sp. SJ-3 TaxID=3454628 RepID=UPI003F78CC23